MTNLELRSNHGERRERERESTNASISWKYKYNCRIHKFVPYNANYSSFNFFFTNNLHIIYLSIIILKSQQSFSENQSWMPHFIYIPYVVTPTTTLLTYVRKQQTIYITILYCHIYKTTTTVWAANIRVKMRRNKCWKNSPAFHFHPQSSDSALQPFDYEHVPSPAPYY